MNFPQLGTTMSKSAASGTDSALIFPSTPLSTTASASESAMMLSSVLGEPR